MSEKYLSNELGERESLDIILANKSNDSYVSSSDDSENEIQDVCRSDVSNNMYYYKQDSADTNFLLKLIQRRRDKPKSKSLKQTSQIIVNRKEFKNYSLKEVSRITKELINLKLNNDSPTNSKREKPGSSNNLIGESSFSFDIPLKKDGMINSKFYPPKTKVCRDDSNKNVHFSNLNVSSFSTYLENNPMLRYFDSSTSLNIAGDTLNMDTNLLTKPTAFFVRRSDKDLFLKQEEKENRNSSPKKEIDFPVFPVFENVNNAFINMNVNMNVTNNCPVNKNNVNNSTVYPGNVYTSSNSILDHSKNVTNNSFNSNFNQNLSADINHNKIFEAPSELSENEFYANNFSGNIPYHQYPEPNNLHNTFNNFAPFRNDFNPLMNRDSNKNCVKNTNMNHFNYSYNYSNPNKLNYFSNSHSNVSSFPYNNPNNFSGPNLSLQRGSFFPTMSSNSQTYRNSDNYINIQNNSQNNICNNNMYNSPSYINTFNNNNNFVSSNIRPNNSREVNRSSKPKHFVPNYHNMEISELAKYVYVLAKDQGGCRFIQKKLDEEGESLLLLIYQGVMEHLVELMNDAFGNYLIQKLFEFLTEEQLFQVLGIINPHIEYIAANSHGTRVLQRLIDFLSTGALIISFGSVLRSALIELMKDINGTHILLKFFTTFDLSYIKFAYDLINENLIEISLHKNGCCAIQKCLEIATGIVKRSLINNVIDNCLSLIIDPYGNYVVQHVIYLRDYEVNKHIIKSLLKDIIFFSKQKFSSNVVEKCFDFCDEESKAKLIHTLMNKEIIEVLLFDMYGNYVIQKVLAVINLENQYYILNIIAPLMEKLRLLNFGPKIYNKLILSYPQLSSLMFSININYIKSNNDGNFLNKERGIKSNSCDILNDKNFGKELRNSYTTSRFATNTSSSRKSLNNVESVVHRLKHKNSN